MSDGFPIAVDNVSYFYGRGNLRKQILYDVSTRIGAGEIVILTGPSGSGKTTLLTLIGALRSCQEGKVELLGHALAAASERELVRARRKIGFIFQQHNLLESLTVAENVQMALELAGKRSRKGWLQRIEDVLAHVGMAEHIHKVPGQLSGGQKQRVGIARALVTHPQVILADEPTASLDKTSGRNVVELIQKLAREQGAAVVMVTHDNRILDVADRILHLEDGRIRSLLDAVGDNTGRMLNLMARFEPNAYSDLAAFALALTRVASVDQVITEDERATIRRILGEMSELSAGEIELVMQLSQSMVGGTAATQKSSQIDHNAQHRHVHMIEALRAVAAADGEVSTEELAEIEEIAQELHINNS